LRNKHVRHFSSDENIDATESQLERGVNIDSELSAICKLEVEFCKDALNLITAFSA